MDTLLRVQDLKVSYFTYAGEVQAVRGVSFTVEKNQTTAIVGESGCVEETRHRNRTPPDPGRG